jgi:hypothetical protein
MSKASPHSLSSVILHGSSVFPAARLQKCYIADTCRMWMVKSPHKREDCQLKRPSEREQLNRLSIKSLDQAFVMRPNGIEIDCVAGLAGHHSHARAFAGS